MYAGMCERLQSLILVATGDHVWQVSPLLPDVSWTVMVAYSLVS